MRHTMPMYSMFDSDANQLCGDAKTSIPKFSILKRTTKIPDCFLLYKVLEVFKGSRQFVN